MLESNERKILIIIVISLFDIKFNVLFIDGEALLLISCFYLVIYRLAFNRTIDTLKVASKRRC